MLLVDNVSKFYGIRLILKNVSAEFESGSVTLLTGNNGAGKTTLLKMLAGLSRPTSGKIIQKNPDSTIGYLGHATFIYPTLTALENLQFWSKVSGINATKSTLISMLDHVGLKHHTYVTAGIFSRGMLQRLNLARVLLIKSDILLLDEPSTGLDVSSRALLDSEILNAKKRGACVVWVSHDFEHDKKLADREYTIKNKNLELNILNNQILETHSQLYTKKDC